MHMLIYISQKFSHARLLTLYEMNSKGSNNDFDTRYRLLNELLEIVIHVA